MLIIFEGNENSGKTTLIDKLLEWRPWFIKCKRTASTQTMSCLKLTQTMTHTQTIGT